MASVAKSAQITMAQMAGRSSEMDRIAGQLATAWRASAVRHSKTGRLESSIGIRKTGAGKDRLVYSSDPIVVPLELGHYLVHRVKSGRRVTTSTLRWVPGLHLGQKAIASMPEVR